MGVYPAPFTRGDDLDALGGDVEGGDGQEKPKAGEGAEVGNVGLSANGRRLLSVNQTGCRFWRNGIS